MTPPQYHLENIPKTTDFSSFDCGDDDLNDFLISDALQHQELWLSRTYVLYSDANIPMGYFTITLDTLHKGRIAVSDKIGGYPYQKYPAIKLARLAVDKHFQNVGNGKHLMKYFFIVAYGLMKQGGGRFITVDAKNSARGFYQRYGFRIVPSQKNEEIVSMYLDFQKYYQDE